MLKTNRGQINMKSTILNTIGNCSRHFPNFKGKNRLMTPLITLLIDNKSEDECIKTIKMHDSSLMKIDLRTWQKLAFFTGEYDSDIISLLSKILKPKSIVLDVGANVGFYSIAWGMKLKKLTGAQLFSFEPIKPNFDRLIDLIELNNLSDVVYPYNIALGNIIGEIPMRLESNGSTGNAMQLRGDFEKKLLPNCTAKITTLDSFSQENDIQQCDLIKIDIEGAELNFLRGGANFILRNRPIVYSEFNLPLAQAFGYTFVDIIDLATQWDYGLYLQRGKKYLRLIKYPLEETTNFLMLPNEKNNNFLLDLGLDLII